MATTGETPQHGITEATEQTIAQMSEGDFSALSVYATEHLGPAIFYAGIGLMVIFIGYLVAKYVSQVISRPVCRRIDETLGKFVGRVCFYCIMLGVVGSVLSKLGAPLGGLAAMLAAAGFAIGLAFQGTLSNFAAGVLMLVFRPFKVGDVINAGGVTGKVKRDRPVYHHTGYPGQSSHHCSQQRDLRRHDRECDVPSPSPDRSCRGRRLYRRHRPDTYGVGISSRDLRVTDHSGRGPWHRGRTQQSGRQCRRVESQDVGC